MPIPRPLLLALIGAVLVGGAFFASRGLSNSSEESSAPVPPPPAVPDTPAPKAKTGASAATDARQALKGAPVVTSGEFNLHVTARRVDLTAKGSFQSQGLAEMPLFQVELTGETGGRNVDVGAVSMGKTGFITRGDQALIVDPQGWDALSRARAQLAERGPSATPFNGYTKKELASFKLEDRGTLDGAPVLHFRGAIDRKEARSDFGDMVELFEKTSLESPLPGALARSARGGTIDFWVGAEDHIIRRELIRINSAAGPVELDYRRGEVNEPQTISAPADAVRRTPMQAGWDRETFGLAFSALTVGVLTVEPGGGNSAERQQPAREPAPRERGAARKERGTAGDKRARTGGDRRAARNERTASRRAGTTPAEVRRAVNRNQIVILFFRQRGADDDAVAGAVNSVRGRRGVVVFTLPVGKAPKYSEVGAAGVVRAPTVVLIGRDEEPRVFEGFIDSTTLSQAVADAR
jgi:hypothetical protein